MGWRGWKRGEAEWLGLRALLPVLLRWDALVPGAEGKQVRGSHTRECPLKTTKHRNFRHDPEVPAKTLTARG